MNPVVAWSRVMCKEIASYLIRGAEDKTGKWSVIVPPLALFTSPLAVEFEVRDEFEAGDVDFGVARIDKTEPVKIWDGQHRTLGAYIAVERLKSARATPSTASRRLRLLETWRRRPSSKPRLAADAERVLGPVDADAEGHHAQVVGDVHAVDH